MMKEQQMVREFHEKAGATINFQPAWISNEDAVLRVSLIQEELDELGDALQIFNNYGTIEPEHGRRQHYHDPIKIADAIGDILYVVLGTAVSCGIDIEPIFAEIHRSNMSKFIDGHLREDGKWIKGPSYSPANLAPILEAQSKPFSPKPYA